MDLRTNYLGLRLDNPLIAGASPISREVGSVRALEDAGVAAVVLYSLFEEQVEHHAAEHHHFEEFATQSFGEALTYAPAIDYSPRGPDDYVEHVGRVKEAVDIPVIASLNGTSTGGWVKYARMLQDAGADAIELNVYHLATDPTVSAADVEQRYVDVLEAVKQTVNLAVALKIGPYFSSLAHFAKRLDDRGVDGLVLFNRFYQPDIDLETLNVVPDLVLSSPHEMRLPLRWLAILDPIVEASLAATTGVYHAEDVLKLLMTGADAVMLVAALLKGGADAATTMLNGIRYWMEEHEYESVRQMQGSMNHRACSDPSAFERGNYLRALNDYV